MVGNLKKWKSGTLSRTVIIEGKSVTLNADRLNAYGNSFEIRFSWDNPQISFAALLDAVGELPIPPYLNRETEESDKETY